MVDFFSAGMRAVDAVWKTVFGSAEEDRKREHQRMMALSEQDLTAIRQFAAEFQSPGRKWAWSSLIDGLNRLPRPLMALGVVGLFVWSAFEPVKALETSAVWARMPDGFWTLLSIILVFYFGGRMQLKSQDFSVKGSALEAARDIVAMREGFRGLEVDDEPPTEKEYRAAMADAAEPLPNAVIEEWNRRRRRG